MRITLIAVLLSTFSLAVLAAPRDKLTIIQAETSLKGSASSRGLKVTFSIKINGGQAYNILNTPTSLLSTAFETDRFNPVNIDTNREPIFKGIQLKWDAEGAAREKGFFTLVPGKVVTVDHDISIYDFSRSGPGVYTLSPSEFVQIVDPTGSIQLARLEPAPKGELRISSRLWQTMAKTQDKVEQIAVEGDTYNTTAIRIQNCAGLEQAVINAVAAANRMLEEAQDHVQLTHSKSLWDLAPTNTWFGYFAQDRFIKATQTLANIWSPFETQYKTFAFVNRDKDTALINLCPQFFAAPITGYNSK
ncbi:hypothetical protein FRC06_004959, partial [Ceratobasidium sp. 370]